MHLSRLGLLVHLVASLPWWHPSTSALPWHGSILGVLMHLAGAARSAMGVAGIGVHLWWRLLAGCATADLGGCILTGLQRVPTLHHPCLPRMWSQG